MSGRRLFAELGDDVADRYVKLLLNYDPKEAAAMIIAQEFRSIQRDLVRFKRRVKLPTSKNSEELRRLNAYIKNYER